MSLPLALLLAFQLASRAGASNQPGGSMSYCSMHPTAGACQQQASLCQTNPSACSVPGASGGGTSGIQLQPGGGISASNNNSAGPDQSGTAGQIGGGAVAPIGGGGDQQQIIQQQQKAAAGGLAAGQDFTNKRVADISGGAFTGKTGASGADAFGDLVRSAGARSRMGDYDGALSDARQAISLDPASPFGHLKAAEALNRLGKFADAEAEAREALKRDPNNAQAWKNLAWALLRQGKYKDALEAALTAVKLRPDFAEAWAIAAFAAERLHDNASRLAYLQNAAGLNARFQSRLDAVNAGGSAYTDDDDMLVGDVKSSKGTSVPWGAVAGGAGGLLALGVLGGLMGRRRKSRAPERPTLLDTRAATPAAPHAPRLQAPSGAGVVIGKYELGQVIGRGGMGEVFVARDLSLGRSVAIKKMTAGFEELGEQARALFIKEARTVAQLHHPAIVDIYEIVDQGKDLYLVFEYVTGKTTQQLLAEAGRLPVKRAAVILKPVCDALQFAHDRAMVHRDLKPANIMITEQGHVKLMDFGIARSLRDAVETQLGVRAVATAAIGSARTATVVGTPVYMAPEAELGVVCKEGDVYALGVTLYELVTGRLPFSSHAMATEKATLGFAKATTIAADLPPAVDALIEAALQPQVERRLKTPGEFLRQLTAAAR